MKDELLGMLLAGLIVGFLLELIGPGEDLFARRRQTPQRRDAAIPPSLINPDDMDNRQRCLAIGMC